MNFDFGRRIVPPVRWTLLPGIGIAAVVAWAGGTGLAREKDSMDVFEIFSELNSPADGFFRALGRRKSALKIPEVRLPLLATEARFSSGGVEP